MPTEAGKTALRLGLGSGSIFVIGILANWPIAFLAAVFAAMFLQAPNPPAVKGAMGLILLAVVLMGSSWVLFSALNPYPLLFLLGVMAAITVSFVLAARNAPPLLVVLALLASLLLPYLVLTSPELALSVSLWLPGNLAIALFATWVAFTILPGAPSDPPEAVPEPSGYDAARRVLRMALVALPFTLLFFLLEGGAALTLIFIAILAQQLSAASDAGPTVARAMLAANAVGGVAAVIAYELVVVAPVIAVMAICTFILTFSFAAHFAAGRPTSALSGSALVAALVLFGGAMAPFGDDADAKMVDRLWQIGVALIYTLSAFVVVDQVLPERPQSPGDATA